MFSRLKSSSLLSSSSAAASLAPSPPLTYTTLIKGAKDPNQFSEFPAPGDTKKHLLPVYIDFDDDDVDATNKANNSQAKEDGGEGGGAGKKPAEASPNEQTQFWMPDKLCKVCYGCEDAFTMYRRRHHCRMCGQVFCNPCSSFYIDGALISLHGLVRSCRLCHDQLLERTEHENKQFRRRQVDNPSESLSSSSAAAAAIGGGGAHLTAQQQQQLQEQQQLQQQNQQHQQAQHHLTHQIVESPSDKLTHTNNLQTRASAHLEAIVDRLVTVAGNIILEPSVWKNIICSLVREVVSSVDPNVRRGDSMDIRPYVKLKIIPGGSLDENAYVDGIVFRKNVSHKKMALEATKLNPKILLLAGGIEFQRTDTRLSSMDTLIEQEDRYIEILVEKIMSLKPDLILVGKAVARKAQELLCGHKVSVMQNVKPQLLERISRMTGAMMLPSTDHMIQQYGEECLGSCGRFWLRLVQDNPEKHSAARPLRILRTRVARGSTYAYLEGCPSELGCTIVLRGASRETLAAVKEIIRFSIVIAYHLRLEVAYYNDRSAMLPTSPDDKIYEDDSDDEDAAAAAAAAAMNGDGEEEEEKSSTFAEARIVSSSHTFSSAAATTTAKSTIECAVGEISTETQGVQGGGAEAASEGGESHELPSAVAVAIVENTPECQKEKEEESPPPHVDPISRKLQERFDRFLLSASLDVDIGLPFTSELRGLQSKSKYFMSPAMRAQANASAAAAAAATAGTGGSSIAATTTTSVPAPAVEEKTAKDYQTLLFASLAMTDGKTQKSKAEVLRIRFYTSEDIALGQFLIENCFHLNQRSNSGKEGGMLDQVLSFVHKSGRIDVSVHRISDAGADKTVALPVDDGISSARDPFHLPIFMSSYCKECQAVVTPEVAMSEETWKMSFGKFMEMLFYNRSARARTGGCNHCIRDDHICVFVCEGFEARFDFAPVHPFALHVRGDGMAFPVSFHHTQTAKLLKTLPGQFANIVDEFKLALNALEKEAVDLLGHRTEDLAMVRAFRSF